MEFKGTKGRWILEKNNHFYEVRNENFHFYSNIFCESGNLSEENKANANLIAHAPEMLDALHEIVCAFENNDLKDVSFAKELIKSATEVDNV